MGIASARAKLLLFGEHAAVYGHPAVGLALPWPLTVTHTPGGDWELPGLGPHQGRVEDLLGRLAQLARDEGLCAPLPGHLEIVTSIPPGSGFGSSAALCAALASLFWPDASLNLLDRLAWRAEGLFHGTPSGIDTALALRNGWWRLDTSSKPVIAKALPDPGLVLVVGALIRESDTKTLVGDLARRRSEGEQAVIQALETLGHLSQQAADAIEAGQGASIAGLMSQARRGLQTLGLETPHLAAVLDTGLRCRGALGGKLSGAGAGGAFVLLFSDRDSAEGALASIGAAVGTSVWALRPRVVG